MTSSQRRSLKIEVLKVQAMLQNVVKKKKIVVFFIWRCWGNGPWILLYKIIITVVPMSFKVKL